MLSSLRILDLTRNLPGPFATMLLAQMGAEVLQVEDPQRPDLAVTFPPFDEAGESLVYRTLHGHAARIRVALRSPEGVAVIRRLVSRYDILLEGWRPGVLQGSGLEATALRQANPRLIYCSLTGYGQTGPLARRAGHDLNYLARSGLAAATGLADGTLAVPGFQLADVAAGGMAAVIAILGAVLEREQTGQGRHLDVAMAVNALEFMPVQAPQAVRGAPPRPGRDMLSGGWPHYRYYRCSDGGWMAVGALEPKFWHQLCQVLGLGAVPYPQGDDPALADRLAACFATGTRDEWAAVFADHDCCVDPVLDLGEALGSELGREAAARFQGRSRRPSAGPLLEACGFEPAEIERLL
ncbi:MAG TPA: CaiB/BaiF CoA-transferase family protein [Candidatus Xenobia bacterium]|jgi:crotonobetainyl-CoA:carnitine CoA-transferase CaiB-like acyl-CoA transferase